MTTATNAALVRDLLAHAATDRPLDAIMAILEDALDAAQAQHCPAPADKIAWSEMEQSWLLSRAATLLERDIQRYPRHRFTVSLYLDKPDDDSEFLEAREIEAPTAGTAGDAALVLSPYGIGYAVQEVDE